MSGLRVTADILIDESELEERFILSSGPGGQNVNKVASAVQLRFDAAGSPALTEPVRRRLISLAGQRMSQSGIIIITARRFRSQERNRADARERLAELIRRAATPPRPRRPTRPTRASKEKRLETKKARATVKRMRARPAED
jgi:ribosome-associated protein